MYMRTGLSVHSSRCINDSSHWPHPQAAYLAKAGKKVVVLEKRHVLGGAAVTEEIIPGRCGFI